MTEQTGPCQSIAECRQRTFDTSATIKEALAENEALRQRVAQLKEDQVRNKNELLRSINDRATLYQVNVNYAKSLEAIADDRVGDYAPWQIAALALGREIEF